MQDNRNWEDALSRSSKLDVLLLAIEADSVDLLSKGLEGWFDDIKYQHDRATLVYDIFRLACNHRSFNVLNALFPLMKYHEAMIVVDTDLVSVLLNDDRFAEYMKQHINHFIHPSKRDNISSAIMIYAANALYGYSSRDSNDIEVQFYSLCAGVFLLLTMGKSNDVCKLLAKKNELLEKHPDVIRSKYSDVRSLYLLSTDKHSVDMTLNESYELRTYSIKWYRSFVERLRNMQFDTTGKESDMTRLINYIQQHML